MANVSRLGVLTTLGVILGIVASTLAIWEIAAKNDLIPGGGPVERIGDALAPNSGPSASGSTPTAKKLATPIDVAVTGDCQSGLTLTWSAVRRALQYRVEIDQLSTIMTTDTEHRIQLPDDGNRHAYRIVATGSPTRPDSDPSVEVEAGPCTTEPVTGLNIALFLDDTKCEVIPGGGLQGGDVLNLYFRATSIGDVAYDGPIRAVARSNTGLQAQSTGGLTSGPASSFVQPELGGQDYGRTHTFTVTVMPIDGEDVDLADNTDTLTVALPPLRPSAMFDPCA